jgi:hypothetical protein
MRQRKVYADAVGLGATHDEALRQVVDWLCAETLAGVVVPA